MKTSTMVLAVAAAALAIPVLAGSGEKSGLAVGDTVPAYHPTHISGPDKGTDNCPPCTYGARPAVQMWFSPGEDTKTIEAFAKVLNTAVEDNKKVEFKGFLINLTDCEKCVDKVKVIAKATPYQKIAFATLASSNEAVKSYKVSTDKSIMNTVFVYKDKKVIAKFVNLKADKQGLADLQKAIAQITS